METGVNGDLGPLVQPLVDQVSKLENDIVTILNPWEMVNIALKMEV